MDQDELLELIAQAAREGWTELDLSYNYLRILPQEIGQLTALRELNLTHNTLTALPPEISQLTALQDLNLTENQLTTLPPEIGQLTALTSLDLYGNCLTILPPEIGQLIVLPSLDLRNNRLTTLPSEIGQLTNLQSLNLRDNVLTTLPPEIGQLTNLQSLDLRDNVLTTLPPEIGQLTNLQSLEVIGNPDFPLPKKVLAQVDNAQVIIRTYLDYLARHKTRVDESRAGKTSSVTYQHPNAGGIDNALLSDLHAALLRCPPFTSDADLRTLFTDQRIYHWRDELLQTNTPAARARAVVDYLHNRYSTTGENALVLFLHVLADNTNPNDALHLTLRTLAHALTSLIQRPTD